MEPLQVMLFGGFQLRCGSESVPPMPSRAARSLFGYLVIHPGTSHPRERIAAEFWPDLPAARARRRLSHTLWQVQDALGELVGDRPYLQVTSESIGFDRELPFWVDVAEFERGIDRARVVRAGGELDARALADLERSVELYRGEFLAGHYDAWIAPEQERLHQRYLEALAWLVAATKQQGAFEDALLYARRLTNEDPLREDGHREVMKLSVLLGRTSDAIRQYERCAEVLSAELGTSPSAATRQLYERILRRSSSVEVVEEPQPTPFPERVPLVGRARERETGIGVLERALGGRGGAVLVEGEPGLGKSRLLAEAVDDAHWRSFVTLHASCRGPETMPPYTVVQDLLEGVLTPLRVEQLRPRVDEVWLAEAARLVPVLSRAVADGAARTPVLRHIEGAQRLRDALVHVMIGLSAIDPIAVVVDDLQWSDAESLDVLEALAGELADHQAALLVGYRGDDARARSAVWTAIRGIDRRLQPERIVLEPIGIEATAELARALGKGRTISPAIVRQLQRETGGNPLFLMETLRTLTEQEQLSLLEADDATDLPLPGSIRALIVGRLDGLAREVREVLDLAAVVGDGIDLDLLTEATELPREVVVDAADTLVRRGLLTQAPDALELRHHQVRRAALEELSRGRSTALHLRVGQALERLRPLAVERLAHHFVEADHPREAVTYLVKAARNAIAVHAYATADGYLRTAVEQQNRGPVGFTARFDLLAEHESVLDVLGDREAQGEVLAEMSLLASEDRHHAEVARRQTSLLAHRGDLEEAIATGYRAVEQAELIGDDALVGPALVALGTALVFGGKHADAVGVLGRAAEVTAEPAEEAEVRTMLGNVHFRLQSYGAAEAELARATDLAEASGAVREEARALGALGPVRAETGDWEGAAELHELAIERCRAIGFRYGEAVNLVNLATVMFNLRRVSRAVEAYVAAERLFESLADQRGRAMVRMNLGFARYAVLGDEEAAERDLAEAKAYFDGVQDLGFSAQCCDGLAGLAIRRDDLDRGARLLDEGRALAQGAGDHWALAQLHARQAELHLRASDAEAALQAIREAVATAEAQGFDALLPELRANEGEILLSLGQLDEAVAATQEAVKHLTAGTERSYLVRFKHHLALAAKGEESLAADQLATARAELSDVLRDLDPETRERAALVPEHARILADEGATATQLVTLDVAAASAPVGRPLKAAEILKVVVDLSGTDEQPDDPVEARRWLLQTVVDQITAQGGAPTIGDLATVLEVSQATVRRDLAALRGRGDVVATRGHRAG